MKNTFEDYKKAILTAYEISKTGKNSHYLLDPTPANLKKMASELCTSLSPKDEQAFSIFFNFKQETDSKSKAVLLSDTDKFRPLSKFLKSKTNLQENAAADIVAVLVNYEHRPFVRFREIILEKKDNAGSPKFVSNEKTGDQSELGPKIKRPKIVVIAMLLMIMGLSAFAINKSFEKKCMVWKGDHYEKISCEPDEKQSIIQDVYLEPINSEKLEYFRKINVNHNTIFFKNGKPVVWYVKQNKQCEFFSAPGIHPISKKSLREVTPYIVAKYCYKK